MDFFNQAGIELIQWVQGWGPWLGAPMRFFTFLGSEDFFLLVLPILYWSVNSSLGMRVGYILLFSSSLNQVLKMALAAPRPYWISSQVKALSSESSFGAPSGHAEHATGIWGSMAAYMRKAWSWAAAVVLIFLIGFSRVYLAVHFPHDVLLGWLLGAVTLWLFILLWEPVTNWLKTLSFGRQVGLAFLISMGTILAAAAMMMVRKSYSLPESWSANLRLAGEGLPNPLALSGILTNAGMIFGLSLGLAWMQRRGGFQASGPLTIRALRYLLGLAGVLLLWYGLGAILPRGEALLPYVLRYLRYALVGVWVTGGAPWLFQRLKLVGDSGV